MIRVGNKRYNLPEQLQVIYPLLNDINAQAGLVRKCSFKLTANQINNLDANPVQLLPSPGPNKIIIPTGVGLTEYRPGSTPFVCHAQGIGRLFLTFAFRGPGPGRVTNGVIPILDYMSGGGTGLDTTPWVLLINPYNSTDNINGEKSGENLEALSSPVMVYGGPNGALRTLQVVDVGLGYSVDDILTLDCHDIGATENPTVRVTGVNEDGGVTGVSVESGGKNVYLNWPNPGTSNPDTPITSSGSDGSGATFLLTGVQTYSGGNGEILGYFLYTILERP